MGAFGAALAAKDLRAGEEPDPRPGEELKAFQHTAKPITCNGCTNHCSLTINQFDGGRRFISGNRCSRAAGRASRSTCPTSMKYKYEKLRAMHGMGQRDGSRGKIGIPFALNMYENLPFWFEFFTKLGFDVVLLALSPAVQLYIKGQRTIPSDTVCYPAKLVHGHVLSLLDEGVDTIFYPCMSYNFDEHIRRQQL